MSKLPRILSVKRVSALNVYAASARLHMYVSDGPVTGGLGRAAEVKLDSFDLAFFMSIMAGQMPQVFAYIAEKNNELMQAKAAKDAVWGNPASTAVERGITREAYEKVQRQLDSNHIRRIIESGVDQVDEQT